MNSVIWDVLDFLGLVSLALFLLAVVVFENGVDRSKWITLLKLSYTIDIQWLVSGGNRKLTRCLHWYRARHNLTCFQIHAGIIIIFPTLFTVRFIFDFGLKFGHVHLVVILIQQWFPSREFILAIHKRVASVLVNL